MVDRLSAESVQQFTEQLDEIQKAKDSQQIDDASFREMLTDLIADVDQAQKEADQSIQNLATGENTDIHEVVTKMEEADLAFDMMKSVRDKLVNAYKELMRG